MESVTYLKNIRIAPKKLRFFTESIKKVSPVQATNILLYSPEKPAQVFYKSIKSAINNAKQTLKVSDDLLQFKTLLVEEGQKMRRYRPGGRGTARMIKKKYSHIKIVLTAKEQTEPVKKEVKAEAPKKEAVQQPASEKPKVKRTVTRKKKSE